MIQVSDLRTVTAYMQWPVRISHFFLILLWNGWLLFSAFSRHQSAAEFQREREAAFLGLIMAFCSLKCAVFALNNQVWD